MSEKEHIPQTSADPIELVDERGVKLADSEWGCPHCGERGALMWRPGSKNTCATCFWVNGGQYNDYVLPDWPLLYRQGQRLLAAAGEPWHGTPGDIGTRLRTLFDRPEEAAMAIQDLQNEEPVTSVETLGEFA